MVFSAACPPGFAPDTLVSSLPILVLLIVSVNE